MLNDLINVLFCPESNLSISFIIFVWHNRLLENHKNAIFYTKYHYYKMSKPLLFI